MFVDVPERVLPVAVVEVSVAAEHLFHDALTVLVKGRGETARLSDPVLRGVGVLGTCILTVGLFVVAKGEGSRGYRVRREHDRVVNLADDPLLDPVDELGGGYPCSLAVYQPCVC